LEGGGASDDKLGDASVDKLGDASVDKWGDASVDKAGDGAGLVPDEYGVADAGEMSCVPLALH
jgi:hypothetical protein